MAPEEKCVVLYGKYELGRIFSIIKGSQFKEASDDFDFDEGIFPNYMLIESFISSFQNSIDCKYSFRMSAIMSSGTSDNTLREQREEGEGIAGEVVAAEEVMDVAIQREEVVGRKVLLKRLRLKVEVEAAIKRVEAEAEAARQREKQAEFKDLGFIGVQQLVVTGLSGKFYEMKFGTWIRTLSYLDSDVMDMLVTNESHVHKWTTDYSPIILEIYKDFVVIAENCEVHFNGDDGYEVSEGTDTHIVNLMSKKCSCRTWDLSGIPCPHAIRAYKHRNKDPIAEGAIHPYYNKATYLSVYLHKLQSVSGSKFWKYEKSQDMEPPEICKM
ncbi:hypothetical protein RND71_042417 [Anisodus tanguticus]|uniref:SWIM-type domain-containing protein n=1 Tax=Anisodus tanguticus TaxID=243964 RepID=A0AAE1UUM0_9SOLA|nr:hypothetical protein RND71_042417 [Anisodus tanguticus]